MGKEQVMMLETNFEAIEVNLKRMQENTDFKIMFLIH